MISEIVDFILKPILKPLLQLLIENILVRTRVSHAVLQCFVNMIVHLGLAVA